MFFLVFAHFDCVYVCPTFCRALTSFALGDSKQLVTLVVGMTEADISNRVVGESCLIMAAAFLLRMEALTIVNLAGTGIAESYPQGLVAVAAALPQCK